MLMIIFIKNILIILAVLIVFFILIIEVQMGNSQTNYSSSDIQDWNSSGRVLEHYPGNPTISYLKSPNIYNQYVGLQFIIESKDGNSEQKQKTQMQLYKLRQNKLHPNVIGVFSITTGKSLYKFGNTEVYSTKCIFKVITQYLEIRLCEISSLNFQQSLEMLKGITIGAYQIYKKLGGFIITADMVGIDSKGNVKVWINSNFGQNFPQFKAIEEIGQKQMCFQIYKLVAKYISQNRSFPPQLLNSIIEMDSFQRLLFLLKKATDCQVNKQLMLQLVLKEKTLETLHKNEKKQHIEYPIKRNAQKQQSYYAPSSNYNFKKNSTTQKPCSVFTPNLIQNGRFRFSKCKTIMGLNSMQPKDNNYHPFQKETKLNQSNQVYMTQNRKEFVNSPIVDKRKNATYDQLNINDQKYFENYRNERKASGHTPHASVFCQRHSQLPIEVQKTKTFRPKTKENIFFSPQQPFRSKRKQTFDPSRFFNKSTQTKQPYQPELHFQKQNLKKNRASNPQFKASQKNVKDSQIGRHTVDSSNLTNICQKQPQKINSKQFSKMSSEKQLYSGENIKSTFCEQNKTKKLVESINKPEVIKQNRKKVRFNQEECPTLVSIESHQSIVLETGKSLKFLTSKSDNKIIKFSPLQQNNNVKCSQGSKNSPWWKNQDKKSKCTSLVQFMQDNNFSKQQKRKEKQHSNELIKIENVRRKNSIENLLGSSSSELNKNQFGTQIDEYQKRTLTEIQKEYMKRFINEEQSDKNISMRKMIDKLHVNCDGINELQESDITGETQCLYSKQSGQTIIEKFKIKKNQDFSTLFSEELATSKYSSNTEEQENEKYQQQMCFLKDKKHNSNKNSFNNEKSNFFKNSKITNHNCSEEDDQNQTVCDRQKNHIDRQLMQSHFPLSSVSKIKNFDDTNIDPVQWQTCEINLDELVLNLSRSKNQGSSFLHTIKQTQRDRQHSSQFDQMSQAPSFVKRQNSRGSLSAAGKYSRRSVDR